MAKQILSFILITLCILTSCGDNIDIRQGETPKFVIYAFPSASDTIPITISVTKPAGHNTPALSHATISVTCLTNGKADEIMFADSSNVSGLPVLTYYAIGKHKTGDRVRVSVEPASHQDGLDLTKAWGETQIPESPSIDSISMDTIFHKEDDYTRLKVSFNKTHGVQYYAARVKGMEYFESVDSISCVSEEIETSLEPLLNGLTDTELNFGTNNDFYHLMYAFDSSQVTSQAVTLHLCVLELSYTSAYRVELFSLSPEFYQMLKSINDINNNDIGAHGLAFIQPTYTNISDGYGCVAGYGCVKSQWLE